MAIIILVCYIWVRTSHDYIPIVRLALNSPWMNEGAQSDYWLNHYGVGATRLASSTEGHAALQVLQNGEPGIQRSNGGKCKWYRPSRFFVVIKWVCSFRKADIQVQGPITSLSEKLVSDEDWNRWLYEVGINMSDDISVLPDKASKGWSN